MAPSSSRIGRWRSVAAEQAHLAAREGVLRTHPKPTESIDLEVGHGNVRYYEWPAAGAERPVLLGARPGFERPDVG